MDFDDSPRESIVGLHVDFGTPSLDFVVVEVDIFTLCLSFPRGVQL